MQVEGTRMYRVRDVAKHFDVSVATIYRAIESGQLDAVKLGTGKGMLRVTEGKAHKAEHLGIAGRRVLVSRKWSNKTLDVPLCSTSTRIAQRRVSAGQLPNGNASGGGWWWPVSPGERPSLTWLAGFEVATVEGIRAVITR